MNMSAWIVSKAHIDAMVWLATRPQDACHGIDSRALLDADDPFAVEHEIGSRLTIENRFSVEHRYPDDAAGMWKGPYTYTPPVRFPTCVEALKIVRCYEYQSCEHPGWGESWARGVCDRLTSTLIGELPGYDAAPWGWDGKPKPGQGAMISLSDLARHGSVRK